MPHSKWCHLNSMMVANEHNAAHQGANEDVNGEVEMRCNDAIVAEEGVSHASHAQHALPRKPARTRQEATTPRRFRAVLCNEQHCQGDCDRVSGVQHILASQVHFEEYLDSL